MSTPFERYQRTGLNYSPPKTIGESGQAMTDDIQDIPPKPEDPQGPSEFEHELESLINRHSLENESGTPDFILAAYLVNSLAAFNTAVQQRANWRAERIGSIFNIKYEKKLPVSVYDEHGRRNDIGEAEIEVWPGETTRRGRIVGVTPIFEREVDNATRSEQNT